MKKIGWIALALSAALALPALAGGKSYEKCKEDTQACLNQMASYYKTHGWVGIMMDDDEKTHAMKVTKVIPGSPAEAAGFQSGDVLVSVNGAKFAENTEAKCVTCERTKEHWLPGSKAEYVVSRGGKDVAMTVTLGAFPPDVVAQAIGMHMLEHAKVDVAQK